MFDRVFNKINQREYLWKKVEYESEKSNSKNGDAEEKLVKNGACTPFFCCNSRKTEENKNIEKKSLVEVSNDNGIQYMDIDDDENDKYRNIIKKMNNRNLNIDNNNKKEVIKSEGDKNISKEDNKDNAAEGEKKGGCLIF